jgi:hypothetical protein
LSAAGGAILNNLRVFPHPAPRAGKCVKLWTRYADDEVDRAGFGAAVGKGKSMAHNRPRRAAA